MMDQPPASAPHTRRAVTALHTQIAEPETEPVEVEAAHVLSALLTATVMIGGGDEHVWHWLRNSGDLAKPRVILAGRRVRGGGRGRTGRLVAADLAAYDTARPEHRQAVREIITAALTRPSGITQ
ncbi:hypothetical protein NE857_33990 (plasmid) [Nocardiopsis exhalans]|uniref:Uncharacterized protein n=1 Tax=Nocardiopsis exhalans TaxID=163604 RepID=A0ABY5DJ93_9ACTN|nr:hypothetical protein [Nocardiopsis exhalans]USY23545.1 hypothetical protein NE857_33990 [Nocardiopsis exhalans]